MVEGHGRELAKEKSVVECVDHPYHLMGDIDTVALFSTAAELITGRAWAVVVLDVEP